jgi:hypothetical protein
MRVNIRAIITRLSAPLPDLLPRPANFPFSLDFPKAFRRLRTHNL